MEESLERYFDKFIADGVREEEEEEEQEEDEEEQFFRLLPDELLTLTESDLDQRGGAGPPKNPDHLKKEPTKDPDPQRRMDPPGRPLTPKIRNITSSVNLGCSLDLNYIAANAWNIKYNKRKFLGLSMMIRKPRATGVFHTSGKLICLGADSVEKSRVAARRLARIVQKLGFPVRFLEFKVHNLMASCRTHPIDLERMAAYDRCCYEPELFPGLFYSVLPGINITVFRSGILTLSGAKSQADIDRAFQIAEPVLNSFRKEKKKKKLEE